MNPSRKLVEAGRTNAAGAMHFLQRPDLDVLNSLPLIVWTADADTFRFKYVSEGAERLLGYPAEQWIDDPSFWRNHIHPDDRNVIAACHSHTQACRDHTLLYRMIAADGRSVWLRDTVQIRSEHGKAVELYGVMFDVSSEIEAQRALAQSEENYRRMVHYSPDAIGVHRDGVYLYVNPSFTRLLGARNAKELIGRQALSLIHPDYVEAVRDRLHNLSRGEHAPPLHERLLRTDGSTIDVEVTALPITFSGAPAVQVVFRDISERVRAEERIRLISMGTHEAIFEGDLSTNDVWTNEAYRVMFGTPKQFDVAREERLARVHPDDRERVAARACQRLDTGATRWTDEYRMELATGAQARVLERGRILHDSEGKPAKVLVALLDITALRDAEEGLEAAQEECERMGIEALRERAQSEQRYRQIVEGVSDVIYTLDSEGRIESLNRAFETLSGMKIDDWLGRSFTELLLPDSAGRAMANFRLVLHGLPNVHDAYRMRAANGAVMEIETSGQQRVAGDPTQGTMGMARDVTERNLMANRLEEAKRLASLGDLAASMAHEMNNVLMAIQPYCELLIRRTGENEFTAAARRTIDATIARGKRITNEILTYTNPKKAEPQRIEPGPWMADVYALIEPLLPKNVALRVETRLREAIIGDQQHLEQVVTNLVANAAHAMPEGGVLTLELQEDIHTRCARLTVRDTGAGIAADILPQIFEPLFTTKRGGTGLGLAIAKRLVEAQGGTITVESTEEGTAFHVLIPIAQ
jgi:PAS domain S-box-containing protein